METEKDTVYVRHILLAIEKIGEYVARGGRDLFDRDTAIQDAIVKQIEIIGEASRKISEVYQDSHQDIPWRKMAGMRDKLVHDYMGIDLEAVWKTAIQDLPPLKKQVEVVLSR